MTPFRLQEFQELSKRLSNKFATTATCPVAAQKKIESLRATLQAFCAAKARNTGAASAKINLAAQKARFALGACAAALTSACR